MLNFFFSIIVTGMYCKCYTSLFCFSSIKQGTPVFFKDWLCEYVHKKKWKHCNHVHKLCVYFLLIYCNVKFLTEFLMLYWKSKKALRWTTAVQKNPTEMEQSEWSIFFFFFFIEHENFTKTLICNYIILFLCWFMRTCLSNMWVRPQSVVQDLIQRIHIIVSDLWVKSVSVSFKNTLYLNLLSFTGFSIWWLSNC